MRDKTLPPLGIAPSLPPTPLRRAWRGVWLAVLGAAAMAAALLWSMNVSADAMLFAYGDDVAMARLARKLLYGVGGAALIGACVDLARAIWSIRSR